MVNKFIFAKLLALLVFFMTTPSGFTELLQVVIHQ